MPSNIVKSFADKSGKSIDEVEKLWTKAKEIADEQYSNVDADSTKYYKIVVGILKNMLDLREESNTISFKDYYQILNDIQKENQSK